MRKKQTQTYRMIRVPQEIHEELWEYTCDHRIYGLGNAIKKLLDKANSKIMEKTN